MAFLSIHSSPLGRAGTKDTGGMSTYLRGLSMALGAAGHRVDLFTRAAVMGVEGVREMGPNVRLISLDDGRGPLAKNEIYPHCSAVATAIDRFCRREEIAYRTIFSHYWLSGCVGRILRHNWDVPHMIMFHTLGRAKIEACCGENESPLRLVEEERLARECDLVIVAAETEKEKLHAYYGLAPEKIAVIPCGIDRSLFRPLDRGKARERTGSGIGGEKVIFSVGRIEPVKDFDLLIRAAALLPAEDNFILMIAGGDDRGRAQIVRLKETAAGLGISGKVIFTGPVDHTELPFYYNAADVTVLPSHYESFGLVALETIACGTPLVAGPVGIVPELLTKDVCCRLGFLVSDRSPANWAAGIREALLRSEPITPDDIDSSLAPYNWPDIAHRLASLSANL